MDLQKRLLWMTCLFALALTLAATVQALPTRVGHLEVELVSPVRTVQPGQPFEVGLHFTLDDHWHLYWQNPGDAGLPPKMTWSLPDGFVVEPIRWPIPEKTITPPLASYGYSHELIVPLRITPPPTLAVGQTVTLSGKASWLVCREECVPGDAQLSLMLEVADHLQPDSIWAPKFAAIQYPSEADFAVQSDFDGTHFQLRFPLSDKSTAALVSAEFYSGDRGVIDHIASQPISIADGSVQLTIPKNEYLIDRPDSLQGLLVLTNSDSTKSYVQFVSSLSEDQPVAVTATTTETSFWQAILFAFIGGLILNLMPCVLPVLSLKILGFVNHADATHTKPLHHGMIFTAGVLVSFWLLAGTLLFLKAGGEQLGWGFQLQSPIFLVVITSFIFLFGLNLLGLFELGTSFASAGAVAAGKTGFGGSFLNGVTATIVATPCTAPFMGSALGYSLAQPAWIAMLIFTSIALGMAAPYLALSASPKLLRYVPRPGRWMETFKQFLGFVLLATVLWLLWVLGIQIGTAGLIFILAALLLLAVAGWIIGRWDTLVATTRAKLLARGSALVLAAAALVIGISGASFENVAVATRSNEKGAIAWETFTPERVEELRTAGKPIFIDFTAAWCLSCQVNEKVAFSSADVQQRFLDLGIVPLKADWTARDQVIAQALARFGRNSVPLYVLYHNSATEPILLPEILTPGIVLEALNSITDLPANNSPTRQVTIHGEEPLKERS